MTGIIVATCALGTTPRHLGTLLTLLTLGTFALL